MILQKMKFLRDGELGEYVCGVNEVVHGGEFTFCGCAIPDSYKSGISDDADFQAVGNEYTGKLKDITCPMCKGIIYYIKSLK
jgi:hypothetical protein